MADTKITFDIEFNNRGFNKGFSSVEKQLDDMSKTLSKASNNMNKVFDGSVQKNADKLTDKLSKQAYNINKVNDELKKMKEEYEKIASGDVVPQSLITLGSQAKRVSGQMRREAIKNDRLVKDLAIKTIGVDIEKDDVKRGVSDGSELKLLESEKANLEQDLEGSTFRLNELTLKTKELNDKMMSIRMNPEVSKEAVNLSSKIQDSEFKLTNLSSEANKTNAELQDMFGMNNPSLSESFSRVKNDMSELGANTSNLAQEVSRLFMLDKASENFSRFSSDVKSKMADTVSSAGAKMNEIMPESVLNKVNRLKDSFSGVKASVSEVSSSISSRFSSATELMGSRISQFASRARGAVSTISPSLNGISTEASKVGGSFSNLRASTSDMASALRAQFSKVTGSIGKISGMAKKSGNDISQSSSKASRSVISSSGKARDNVSRGLLAVGSLTDKVGNKMGTFAGRITRIAKAAFIFNVFRRGFASMRDYMGSLISTNSDLSNSLATVAFNLKVAFQPIWDFIVPALMTLISWLNVALEYIGRFMAMLFGTSYEGARSSVKALDAQKKATEGVGKAAKKAGKESEKAGKKAEEAADRQLQGFDQLNKMAKENEDVDTSGAGAGAGDIGGGGASGPTIQAPKLNDSSFVKGMERIKDLIGRVGDAFKKFYNEWGLVDIFEGIKRGIDQVDWANIWNNLKIIGRGLKEIGAAAFDSGKRISKAMGGLIGVSLENQIKIMGSIFDSVIQGVANFIEKNKANIVKWIDETTTSLENSIGNMTEIYKIMGDEVFESFERNKERIAGSVEGVLGALFNLFSGAGTLIADILEITTERLLAWYQENAAKLGEAYDGIIRIFTDLLNGISGIVNGLVDILREFWEEYGKEIYDGIVDIITSVMTWILDFFNDVVMPIWDNLVETFSTVWEENLKPMLSALMDFVGEVGLLLKALWENHFKPHIDFLVKLFGPMFKWVFNTIVDVVGRAVGLLADIIRRLLEIFKGITAFITGVFTGDWQKAWDGIKDIFGAVWDSMVSLVKTPINSIISMINTLVSGVFEAVNGIGDAFGSIDIDIPDSKWIPKKFRGMSLDLGVIPKVTAPKIPMLAKGGLIPPRRPRQVIVGDNMSEDEIVSPVSTMKQAFAEVLAQQGGGADNALVAQLLRELIEVNKKGSSIMVDNRVLGQTVVNSIKGDRSLSGKSLI